MGVQPVPGLLTGSADRRREDLPKPDNRRCRDGERGGKLHINWNAAKEQDRHKDIPEPELSPLSKKVRHFDRYSRKGGRWSWKKRPPYERDVVNLIKAERRMEENIGSAITEVEAVEAGLRYFDEIIMSKAQTTVVTQTTNADISDVRPQGRPPRQLQQDGTAVRQNSDTAKGKGSNVLHGRGPRAAPPMGNKHQSSERGIGSGRSTRGDEAVARCVDLKLTLKQRLDNYDRHRGINIQSLEAESSASPGVPNEREGLFAPAEGTALDRSSVSRIVSRSLGDAAAKMRRNSTQNGNDNENYGGDPGGLSGSSSRWRSWQECPPHALAKTPAPTIATKGTTSEEKASDYPGTPSRAGALNGHGTKYGGITTDGVVSGGASRHKAMGAICLDSCDSSSLAKAAGTADAQSSAASSSSATSYRGGVPLVPRVATLPSKNKTRESYAAGAPRKTKDFDPDNLQCVRRHEASVAERAQRTQRLRMETDKRSLFKARPLPIFLGVGDTTGGCSGSSSSGGTRGGGGDSGRGATGEMMPDLITALEQDEEARELIEKIRKVNPRADIASVVLQSSSTIPPVNSPSWVANGGRRRPRSGKTIAVTAGTTAAAAAPPSGEVGAGTSSSSTGQESPIFPERQLSRDLQIHCPDDVVPSATRNGDGEHTPEGGVAHPRDGGGGSGAGAQPRSLMGRMLGSGMLDRQREWAKARGKKVLESRRQAEEAKEQEGKGDILETGLSERSWLIAKMQHLRSLERQTAEDETREQLREARRRASLAKAHRECESSERQTMAIAATLLAADAIGKGSYTAPNSRGGPRKTRRDRPPRRSRSHAGDGATDIPGDALSLAGDGQRCASVQRRQGLHGTGARSETGAGNASDVENMSEEEFYRVAIEKIIERERLGGVDSLNPERPDLSGVQGGENLNRDKSSSNRRKNLEQIVTRSSRTKSFGGTLNPAAKPSRPGRRFRVRENRGSAGARRQRASDAARAKAGATPCQPPSLPRGGQASTNTVKQRTAVDAATHGGGNASSLKEAAGRHSSLLSLYEAQSVEQSALRDRMPEGFVGGSVVGSGDKVGSSDNLENRTGDHWIPMDANRDTDDGVGEYPWPEEGWAWSRGGRRVHECPRGCSAGNDTEMSKIENRGEQGLDGDGDVWEQRLRLAEDKFRRTQAKVSQEEGDDEVFGDIDPPRRSATNQEPTVGKNEAEKEERWDDVLDTDERNPNRSSPPRFPIKINPRQAARNGGSQGTGRLDDHLRSSQDTENVGNAASGEDKILSLKSYPYGREYVDPLKYNSTRTTATAVTVAQRDSELAEQNISITAAKGGFTGHGVSLWSSTDSDASMVKIGSSSSSSSDSEKHGARGFATQVETAVGGGQWDPSFPVGGYGAICVEGSARSPAQPREGFFDPATSSADKGRFKVRDPRYFDACSMRRMPDIGGNLGGNSTSGKIGSTAGSGEGTAHDATGIALLLGRMASGDMGGEPDDKEKVITVMFDRSKFNEDEAKRWWALNRTRITGDN